MMLSKNRVLQRKTHQELITTLSVTSLDLLVKYPAWRNAIFDAYPKGSLPGNYEPQIVEFFDQQGLLASQVAGQVFNAAVPVGHQSEFLALMFDGELVVFCTNKEIVLNRLGLVSVFASVDEEGES